MVGTFIISIYEYMEKQGAIQVETSKKAIIPAAGDKIFTSDKSNAERNVANR